MSVSSEECVSFEFCGHRVMSKNTFIHASDVPVAEEADGAARPRAQSVGAVPTLRALAGAPARAGAEEWTTVQCSNVPRRRSVEEFARVLDALGFEGRYDYVYMPLQRRRWLNKGFVFVNMKTVQDRVELLELGREFAFKQQPGQPSQKVQTKRSRTQGVLENLSELWIHIGDRERDAGVRVLMSDEEDAFRELSFFEALRATRGARVW